MIIILLIVALTLGIPISFAILSSTILTQIIHGGRLEVIVQRLYGFNDSFSMLAIPFFFIAGELMLQGGISRRIVDLAKALFGWIKGSLAIISFVSSAFFGAISGSSFATTAAIGGIMYPEMIKDGYNKGFSAAVQAVAGTLGVLIPPSIPAVVYSVLVGVSAGDMFLYLIPVGILAVLGYATTAIIMMKLNPENYRIVKKQQKITAYEVWKATKAAIWALLSPVIILGGIYGGIFTPTESAIVATAYSIIIGVFVYKELTIKNFYKAIITAAIGSAAVMFIIDASAPFGWVLAINRIPQMVTHYVSGWISSPIVLLFLINVLLLIAGMFMETNAILNIIIPIILPLVKLFNINLLHFGVITIFNVTIGTITPPFGGGVFVASGITGVPVASVFKKTMPFLFASILILAIITFVPLLWL